MHRELGDGRAQVRRDSDTVTTIIALIIVFWVELWLLIAVYIFGYSDGAADASKPS